MKVFISEGVPTQYKQQEKVNKVAINKVLKRRYKSHSKSWRYSYILLLNKTAIQKVSSGRRVIVAADDTAVLILPVHHWKQHMENVYALTQQKKPGKAKGVKSNGGKCDGKLLL